MYLSTSSLTAISANLALAAGIIIHFLTFFWPYGVFGGTPDSYDSQSYAVKMVLLIFPNVGLYLGLKGMLRQEESTFGIQWDTLDNPLFADDELTMGDVLLMYAVGAVIYAVITWYIDNVKPGPFGQAKKFYFPFQVSMTKSSFIILTVRASTL